MNRIQQRNSSEERASYPPFAARDISSKDKTKSLLGEVLPLALSLGLSVRETQGQRTSGGANGTGLKSGKAAGAASATGDAGALGVTAGLGTKAGWTSVAGGVMGALDIAMSWGRSTPARGAASGSAVGAMVGTFICPGVGTAIGAAIGAIGGGLLGSIKTGKHKDQKVRDQVREFLMEKGVLDSSYSIGLADGSRFNIGYDGGPKTELGGRRPFETDMSNPLTKYAISWLNPIVALMSQGNEKVQTDFVGYFANAAISNAKSLDDLRINVNTIMRQFGINNNQLIKGIVQAADLEQLDPEIAKAWLGGIHERTNPEFHGDLSIRDAAPIPATAVEADKTDEDGLVREAL